MNDFVAVLSVVVAIVTILGAVGAFFGIFARFSKVLDRNTFAINAINETIKAQWTRIDEHGLALDDHGNRIVKCETRLDYHEKGGA